MTDGTGISGSVDAKGGPTIWRLQYGHPVACPPNPPTTPLLNCFKVGGASGGDKPESKGLAMVQQAGCLSVQCHLVDILRLAVLFVCNCRFMRLLSSIGL